VKSIVIITAAFPMAPKPS